MGERNNAAKFFFVEGFQADAQAKRRMRRHVMMGKNAGRTLQRGSRRTGVSARQAKPSDQSFDTRRHIGPLAKELFTMVPDGRGGHRSEVSLSSRTLRILAVPYSASTESFAVVNQFFNRTAQKLYPVHLGLSLEATKLAWLQILLSNETSFECTLALFRASNEILLGNGGSSPAALYHIGRTLELVNQRLTSDDALSDSTVAIVLSLIIQEQIRQQHAAAQAHMRGLARLIELRGGIQHLDDSMILQAKVYKTDVTFAIQTGSPTLFFLDKTSIYKGGEPLQELASHPERNLLNPTLDKVDHSLRAIWDDAMSASKHIHELGGKRALEVTTYYDLSLSLTYRLLRFRPLGQARVIIDEQSAHHMSLVALMMTVLMPHSHRRLLELRVAAECLEAIFGSDLNSLNDDGFALWFAMISQMWIYGDRGEDRLLQIVLERGDKLGLSSWQDVRKAMESYPWIAQLHDGPGQILWNAAHAK